MSQQMGDALGQDVINQMGVGEYRHCSFCQGRDHEIDDCALDRRTQGPAKRWKPGGGTWARENADLPGETYSDGNVDNDPVKVSEGQE